MRAQRIHERKKVSLPVTYALCGEYELHAQQGTTRDISSSGMCFYTDKPLRTGLTLNMLVQKIWNVPRPCIVKWSRMEKDRTWRSGLLFNNTKRFKGPGIQESLHWAWSRAHK